MKVDSVKIEINADEMESQILKYMKKYGVERREAMRMICSNGFGKVAKEAKLQESEHTII